ncbi:hypothetical protein ACGE24_08460 [Corynebacterium kroppenstedtii]
MRKLLQSSSGVSVWGLVAVAVGIGLDNGGGAGRWRLNWWWPFL